VSAQDESWSEVIASVTVNDQEVRFTHTCHTSSLSSGAYKETVLALLKEHLGRFIVRSIEPRITVRSISFPFAIVPIPDPPLVCDPTDMLRIGS
jgi:hypothetical protein